MKTPVDKIEDDRSLQHELNTLYYKSYHTKCHINICNIYDHPTSAGVFLNPIKLPCIRINGGDAIRNKKLVNDKIAIAITFFRLCFSKNPCHLLKLNTFYEKVAHKVANKNVFLYYSYKTGLYFYDECLHTGEHTYNYNDKYVKVYYLGFCKAKDLDKTLYMLRPIYHRYKNNKVAVIFNKLSKVMFRLSWCDNFSK